MTVVIPVRDDARRLARCLLSIRRNAYAPIEIVVVDNGSSDGSPEVARDAGAQVMILPDASVADLRNAGAATAAGEVLAFVDADHEIDDDWIARAAEVLGPGNIAAAGTPYSAPPDGSWVQRAYDRFRSRRAGVHDIDWLASGNLAVSRRAFVAVGGFDTSLETCEDIDFCQRLRQAGFRVVGDDRLRSVHLGDPATLRALFVGELWRGRDNLRVTLRGLWTARALPSVLVPIANLVCMIAIVPASVLGAWVGWQPAAAAIGTFALLVLVRTARMTIGGAPSLGTTAANFAVAAVYECARALALVVRVGHRVRRGPAPAALQPSRRHA